MRKIGLIGDIHAEDRLLERAIDFLTHRRVEVIAATGDIVDGSGSVDRCCGLLESRHVLAVRGNHDRWLLNGTARGLPEATKLESLMPETLRTLTRLPGLIELDTVQGRALLCHGLGSNDLAKVAPDDHGYAIESNEDLQTLLRARHYRWVLNGHTHRKMVRHFRGVTIVNAGTLKHEHSSGFAEIDFEGCIARFYEFDWSGEISATIAEIPLVALA